MKAQVHGEGTFQLIRIDMYSFVQIYIAEHFLSNANMYKYFTQTGTNSKEISIRIS